MSEQEPPPMAETTRLNKPWLVKMAIFIVVLVFFGCYGLYDATVGYPNRGINYADYMLYQYMDAASSNHQLDKLRINVADPSAELDRLRKLDRIKYGPLDGPRLDWLESLSIVRRLTPEYTKFDDPDKKFTELKARWLTQNGGAAHAPKQLSLFDLTVQWVYTAIGFGGGLWLLVLFVNVARQRFGWEPQTLTLTLSDGDTLTPADIEEFDKRKWDKYLIFLKIRPRHATLGGREIKLDLYRYSPLETWVLAMEKTAFPDRADDPATGAAPPSPPPPPPAAAM